MIRATMKTRKRLFKSAILLALLCLSSCAQTDTDGTADTSLPAGKYPMTFTTAVNELSATRATTDNTWDGGESVTLQVGDETKLYTISVSGSSSTLTSDKPFYWTSSNETKSVCGWYYGDELSRTLKESYTLQENQSGTNGKDGYQMSDFLYAPAQEFNFADNPKSLTFYHQTARVVINIVNAEAATDATQIRYVAFGDDDNLALSGAYTAPTGEANVGTWNTENAVRGTITPKDITSSGSKYLKTYTALVIPQNMQGKKFIAITLTDGETYYYTPKAAEDANFESGMEYTYDVTVKYGHLEAVKVNASNAWGSNGDPIEVKSTAPGFSAYDLKIGDYYYSDGTTSDGGYRKYADGTSEVLNIRPVTKSAGTSRSVIGIVFWVGDATVTDGTLNNDHPNCTNGLVVALKDAADAITWQGSPSSVQGWLDNRSNIYLPVASNTDSGAPLNNIQGYNNTKAIEEFNDGNAGKLVQAVSTVVTYRNNVSAPDTSSGWYLPSAKELTLLCGEDVDDIYFNMDIGTATKDIINKKIGLIGDGATKISSADYWSSTEYSDDYAFFVYFDSGYVNYYLKYYTFSVRCVLAF